MKVNKVGKRVLSVVLCLVMLFTTFCIFDIGSMMSSAADSTYVPYTSAKLVVPEAVYLTPKSDGSNSNFQYFINNDENGTPSAAKDTSGKIYFNYPNATSASLSVSGSGVSVSYSSGFSGSNGTYRATISNGSTSSYTSSYITWTVTYTDKTDGQTKTITAKTYVYAPYVYTAAASSNAFQEKKYNFKWYRARIGITSMIYGVHSMKSTGTTIYRGTDAAGTAPDGTGTFNKYPIADASYTPSQYWDGNAPSFYSAGGEGFAYWYAASSENNSYVSGGIAQLYVDSSRYQNLGQIPNFTLRADFNGLYMQNGEGRSRGYWAKYYTLAEGNVASASGNTVTYTSDAYFSGDEATNDTRTGTADLSGISVNIGSIINHTWGKANPNNTKDTTEANAYSACDIVTINKSALRNEIKTAVAEMPIICANGTSVSAFNTALSNAYDNLTKLDAAMSTDTSALVSARQTLENETVNNLRNKLQAKINEAANITVLGKDALTEAFNTALAAAQTAANTYKNAAYSLDNVNGINKALFDLTQAINNLTACDTFALQTAYDAATAKVEEHYTTASWAPLATALADSDVVFMLNTTSKFYATDDYIAAKTEAITKAVNGLLPRWETEDLTDDIKIPTGEGFKKESKTVDGAPYRIYTIEAPWKNAEGQTFSWWADSSGKVVSTYRNYTFYGCTATTLTAVYGQSEEAIAANYAIMRVTGFRKNDNKTDTGIYSIMVERSINRQLTNGKSGLVAHGVIYADTQAKIEAVNGTTDPSTLGGNGVYVTSAKSTATIGNGLFEVRAAASTLPVGGTVYIRPYALINDTYYYFDIVSYEVGAITGASEDADTIDVCADTVEYAVVQNEDKADVPAEDPTVDVPVVDEPTVEEPTSETSWFDMIVAWFKDLINVLISSIIGLF